MDIFNPRSTLAVLIVAFFLATIATACGDGGDDVVAPNDPSGADGGTTGGFWSVDAVSTDDSKGCTTTNCFGGSGGGDDKGAGKGDVCVLGCQKDKKRSKEECQKVCASNDQPGTTCYYNCIGKGAEQKFCETGCTCYGDCLKKGDGKDGQGCLNQCFGGKDGNKGATLDQTCYDGCVKKGESPANCKKVCTKAGGGGKDTAPTGPIDPTFENVYKYVLQPKCSGCHGKISVQSNLMLGTDATAAYKALMKGKGDSACAAQPFVTAGKPMESLLYLKIDSKATHGCGNSMPPKGTLADNLVTLVKEWIAAGASDKAPDKKGDGKGGTLDKTCYDGCIKKGETEATCKAACTNTGDGKGDGKGDPKPAPKGANYAISGSFSTTFGSLEKKTPFATGSGTAKLTIDGKEAKVLKVGAEGGTSPKQAGSVVLQVFAQIDASTTLGVYLSMDDKTYATGGPLKAGGKTSDIAGYWVTYDAEATKATGSAPLTSGTLTLSKAGKSKGEAVEGTFTAEWGTGDKK